MILLSEWIQLHPLGGKCQKCLSAGLDLSLRGSFILFFILFLFHTVKLRKRMQCAINDYVLSLHAVASWTVWSHPALKKKIKQLIWITAANLHASHVLSTTISTPFPRDLNSALSTVTVETCACVPGVIFRYARASITDPLSIWKKKEHRGFGLLLTLVVKCDWLRCVENCSKS